ncbi:MAG: peptide deformylase [Gammaproteobacteria bacterium]
MAVLHVLHFPDPRLRKRAAPVQSVDKGIHVLATDMLETMYSESGVGLAATQVDVQKRVVVIDISEGHNSPMILINPEIVAAEGSEDSEEGCLSVPGYFDTVSRAQRIKYRYQDLDGACIERDAEGLLAICVQHEIDHLDGRLFIDYLSPLKRQRIRRKVEKQEKHQATAL